MRHAVFERLPHALAAQSRAAFTGLDSLVEQYTAAAAASAAIESVSDFEADIRIVEPTFEVDGVYVATRDGRMRVDIMADG